VLNSSCGSGKELHEEIRRSMKNHAEKIFV
jgi:hypothetical protein